jgi:biotin synthase
VLNLAKRAIENGATRVCLGAAWREVRDSRQFEEILHMVKGITELGAEVCCTLGMLKEDQAKRLKEAGLYAYNHNLDTSKNYYPSIISTRKYEDRLETLNIVAKTGLSTCCGGILGMGESLQDRLELLQTLSHLEPHPDSVPINRLTPIAGTPLENQAGISIWEFVRLVAIARIVMPKAMVRLSAGRLTMSYEQQALCFLAGANSIHAGERLLTVDNPTFNQDHEMFQILGLKIKGKSKSD